MKKPYRAARYNSFTLVELLVVMGIIVILAAALTSAASYALRQAQRVKAGSMASQIQGACMNYYTEYGVYPIPSTVTTDVSYGTGASNTDLGNWTNLIDALCGNLNPASPGSSLTNLAVSNTRSIAFMTLKMSDIDTNYGVPVNPISPTNNSYFNIALDGDYNGVISNLPNFNASPVVQSANYAVAVGVAVWADCRQSSTITNIPAYYVHTY